MRYESGAFARKSRIDFFAASSRVGETSFAAMERDVSTAIMIVAFSRGTDTWACGLANAHEQRGQRDEEDRRRHVTQAPGLAVDDVRQQGRRGEPIGDTRPAAVVPRHTRPRPPAPRAGRGGRAETRSSSAARPRSQVRRRASAASRRTSRARCDRRRAWRSVPRDAPAARQRPPRRTGHGGARSTCRLAAGDRSPDRRGGASPRWAASPRAGRGSPRRRRRGGLRARAGDGASRAARGSPRSPRRMPAGARSRPSGRAPLRGRSPRAARSSRSPWRASRSPIRAVRPWRGGTCARLAVAERQHAEPVPVTARDVAERECRPSATSALRRSAVPNSSTPTCRARSS